jgi:hypothetical protein
MSHLQLLYLPFFHTVQLFGENCGQQRLTGWKLARSRSRAPPARQAPCRLDLRCAYLGVCAGPVATTSRPEPLVPFTPLPRDASRPFLPRTRHLCCPAVRRRSLCAHASQRPVAVPQHWSPGCPVAVMASHRTCRHCFKSRPLSHTQAQMLPSAIDAPTASSCLSTLPPPTKRPNGSTQPHTTSLCRLLNCRCRPLRRGGAPAAAEQPRRRAYSQLTSLPHLWPQTGRWWALAPYGLFPGQVRRAPRRNCGRTAAGHGLDHICKTPSLSRVLFVNQGPNCNRKKSSRGLPVKPNHK